MILAFDLLTPTRLQHSVGQKWDRPRQPGSITVPPRIRKREARKIDAGAYSCSEEPKDEYPRAAARSLTAAMVAVDPLTPPVGRYLAVWRPLTAIGHDR